MSHAEGGERAEEADREIAYLAENGVTIEYVIGSGAGIPKDPATVRFFVRYTKASVSPAALAALFAVDVTAQGRAQRPMTFEDFAAVRNVGDPANLSRWQMGALLCT